MRYRDYRWPCDHPAVAHLDCGRMASRVVNVSALGARLAPVDWVGPGDRVMLEVLGQRLGAEVRWCRDGACGLRFDRPLGAREVGLIRHAPHRARASARRSADLLPLT